MSTEPKVTLLETDDSIEAALAAAVGQSNPKLDFGRELTALIERYKTRVDHETIAETLESYARAVKARGEP